jgi:hypothetical protein
MQAATSYHEHPLKLIGKLTAKRFEVRSGALIAAHPVDGAPQVV